MKKLTNPLVWVIVVLAGVLIWKMWPTTPKVDDQQTQIVADSTARADSLTKVEAAKIAAKVTADSLVAAAKTADSLKVAAAKADSLAKVEVAKAKKTKDADSTTVAAKPAAKPGPIVVTSTTPGKGPLATKVDELIGTITTQGQRIDTLGHKVNNLTGRVVALEETSIQLVATTNFLVLREAVRYSQAKNSGESVQADIDAFTAATIEGRQQMFDDLK